MSESQSVRTDDNNSTKIDYDKLAAAVVRALNASGAFRIDVDEIHRALLQKQMRNNPFEPRSSEPPPPPRLRSRHSDEPRWIRLANGGDYADYWVQVRIASAKRALAKVTGSNQDTISAVRPHVLAHNGWPDPEQDDYVALPPAQGDRFWDSLKHEQIILMALAICRG